MKNRTTRKRIANAEKQHTREMELLRLANMGGAQYGEWQPLKHRPFAGLTLPK